jgi:CRP-like cAMP-binding protein
MLANADVGANGLLASLRPSDVNLLEPLLEHVVLPFHMPLETAFHQVPHVYFPFSGVASVIAISKHERRQAEVGLMGCEGMTGIAIVLGADRSPCNVTMQVAGEGLRIKASDLQTAMVQSARLREAFIAFAHVFSIQSQHTALANAQGTIPERMARWLLMMHDRCKSDHLYLTHDLIAVMLGVRRSGITTALGALTSRGLIHRSRRDITILDRDGLERLADGLYGLPEDEYRRLIH